MARFSKGKSRFPFDSLSAPAVRWREAPTATQSEKRGFGRDEQAGAYRGRGRCDRPQPRGCDPRGGGRVRHDPERLEAWRRGPSGRLRDFLLLEAQGLDGPQPAHRRANADQGIDPAQVQGGQGAEGFGRTLRSALFPGEGRGPAAPTKRLDPGLRRGADVWTARLRLTKWRLPHGVGA